MTTGHRKIEKIKLFLVILVALFSAFVAITALVSTIALIFSSLLVLLTAGYLISRYELQYYLAIILALVLPFSVETMVTNTIKINLPGEPLLAIALFSLFWDFVKSPDFLKRLFKEESLWVIPLIVVYIITTITSTMWQISLKYTIVCVTYILVFYVWQKDLFKRHPNIFITLISLYSLSLIMIIAYSLYRYSQYDWYPATVRGIFQPFFKDHTIFGATMSILSIFWISYVKVPKILTSKILYLFLGLLFLAGLIISKSRAAFLSIIFVALVWFMLSIRIRFNYIIVIISIAVILTGISFRENIIKQLQTNKSESHNTNASYIENIESSVNLSSDISNLERLNRWAAGIGMFKDKPFLGFGPGTYQFVYFPYQKKEFINRLTVYDPWHIPENSGGTAHSEYILIMSEMGIIGILAFLFLLGRWSYITFSNTGNNPERKFIFIAFLAIGTYVFHALFNNFLNTDKFAFLFWGIAAWMTANHELLTHNGKQLQS